MSRKALSEVLKKHFSEGEVKALCFNLNIDYEDLPGENRTEKIHQLIQFCERDHRTQDLINLVVDERKGLNEAEVQALWSEDSISQRTNRSRIGIAAAILVVLLAVFAYVQLIRPSGPASPAVPTREISGGEINTASTADGSPTVSPALATTQPTRAAPEAAVTPTQASTLTSPEPTSVATRKISNPVNITDSPGESSDAFLAFDGHGVLHLVWSDNSLRKGGGYDILHRQRNSDGAWSDKQNMTENFEQVNDGISPQLIVRPDGDICLFWEGAAVSSNPSTGGLYMRCNSNEGWTKAQMVENRTGLARSFDPAFSPDGTLHTAYLNPPTEILVETTDLADGFKSVDEAHLAIDASGGLHVVWRRIGDPITIEYRFSNDNGKTWSDVQSLTDKNTVPNSTIILRTDASGFIHLVWDASGSLLNHRVWKPETGWGPTENIVPSTAIYPSMSFGADADHRLHIVWPHSKEILYVQQNVDGSWSKPASIIEPGEISTTPQIAVDAQNKVHMVWQFKSDSNDYYYGVLE